MTDNAFSRATSHLVLRGIQVLLRGGQRLEGTIHIPEGMSLMDFVRMRKFFLNLTSVTVQDGSGQGESMEHLSIRLSNVVWIIPLEGSLHIASGPSAIESKRPVQIQLVDGLTLTVSLNIAEEQRMSDYLDGNAGFLPFYSATLPTTDQSLERLLVNHEAILAIREIR